MDIMERGSSYATLGPENEQGTRAKTERSILVVQPKISKGLGRFGCQGTERMPKADEAFTKTRHPLQTCLLYTSPSPRDATLSRMPSSA